MSNKVPEFEEVMARQSNAKLLDIIKSPEGTYEVLALEAAKKELESRNLTTDQIESTEAAVFEKIKDREDRKHVPLNWHWKVLCVLLPGIIPILLAGGFKADGYAAKAKATLMWTVYGFGFYTLLVIAFSIF
ncbi:hypothetical protein [Mucilaginibacter sp. FT3.2]|uniref:hypothetical protein n=1 Tax=Mucilaginibacter sp. FT3.2 TaxID=2723090 RepID=UPI00160C5502|nr:hypothetical protein [Mucilaginibacter sp. FT3.2]MBB6229973.1 hypothetical protein [Mucilaginibacter sp. FT3.2]